MKQVTKQTKYKKVDVKDQLESLAYDIKAMTMKHPNDEVTEFQITIINSTLEKCNEILGERRPYASFTVFDPKMLPKNGDVMLILDTYLTAMRA